MLLPYYIISSILESFTFLFVSHDCVICDFDRCHTSVMHDVILHSLSMSKIKKSENKIK